MIIFAFSDLHNSDAGLEFLLKEISKAKPDLILCAGDVTTFGPKEFGENVINAMPVTTFGVPGNCDPQDLHSIYDEGNSTNIHGKAVEFSGLNFVGWGGSNTSLNTPFENPEETILQKIGPVMDKASAGSAPIILIAHCPPLGFLDEVPGGMHVGCRSIAEVVDKHHPVLTICGHIHEAKGIFEDKKRGLVIVNVGPSKDANCAVITLGAPDEVKNAPLDNIKIEPIG